MTATDYVILIGLWFMVFGHTWYGLELADKRINKRARIAWASVVVGWLILASALAAYYVRIMVG